MTSRGFGSVRRSPPRSGVAAERLAGIGGIDAWPRLHVHDPYFEDVSQLAAANGADVHAKALARAASEQLAVNGAGTAPGMVNNNHPGRHKTSQAQQRAIPCQPNAPVL